MKLFKEKPVLIAFIMAVSLWIVLPLTTMTTGNSGFIQLGYGYEPVANFRRHHKPPKIGIRVYKQLVWRHERYSFLWLPFWGSKTGEYGLYKLEGGRRRRVTIFQPVKFEQAEKLAALINVKLEMGSPVSYWSLYFGWLVLLPFALIFYWDPDFYRKLGKFTQN